MLFFLGGGGQSASHTPKPNTKDEGFTNILEINSENPNLYLDTVSGKAKGLSNCITRKNFDFCYSKYLIFQSIIKRIGNRIVRSLIIVNPFTDHYQ